MTPKALCGRHQGQRRPAGGCEPCHRRRKEDGSFDQYVLTANELASGDIIEGLVDENGEAVQ